MYQSVRKLKDIVVLGTDGHIGKIDQFLFDEQSWAVRYIAVEIGPPLSKKLKLVSPAAARSFSQEGLVLNLSTDQISNSPDIDTEKPVSRKMEQELHSYYGWSFYWSYPTYTGYLGAPLYPSYGAYPYTPLYADRGWEEDKEKARERTSKSQENSLRSSREITGYTVYARESEIGHVQDLLLDDESWVLRYTIIDTGAFLPGRRILVASHWCRKIDWEAKQITFDIDRKIIENGPQYDTGMAISKDYEKRLFDYYQKPYLW